MVKRMWPALGLVGALLLAAASLQAEENSVMAVSRSRAGAPAQFASSPSTPPLASPAIPGDDDMPNRGGGGKNPTDARITKAASRGSVMPGGKLYEVLSVLGQRGLASLVFLR